MKISILLFVLLVAFAAIGVIFTGLIIFAVIELIINRIQYGKYLDERFGGNKNGKIK